MVENNESFKNLVRLPVAYRCLLIVTAGVTEEVLFRSYAIGIGRTLLDGTLTALVVSLMFFVASHYRWGLSHLLSVFWAGLVLSVLFVITNSLVVCAVTHTLVDAVGLLLAPWGMARKAKREQRTASDAVGTGIAPSPPHRSVRAELPHTALALGTNDQEPPK